MSKLNLQLYTDKAKSMSDLKASLQYRLSLLEKEWDKMDGHGRDAEQAILTQEMENIRKQLELL